MRGWRCRRSNNGSESMEWWPNNKRREMNSTCLFGFNFFFKKKDKTFLCLLEGYICNFITYISPDNLTIVN